LKSKDSPSEIVGFKHQKTLQNLLIECLCFLWLMHFSEKDLLNFEKKILNFLSESESFEICYTAEPKIDGISASLIYKNGEFKIGLSRGDGKKVKI
jgi:DNA ligase (NAD+)